MESVYFESSVFVAIFNGEDNGPQIRALLRELRNKKVRIYTSIVTLQEISVLSFRRGTIADDPCSKLGKLARITGVTKDAALTAAKLEAGIKDQGKMPLKGDQVNENRRRKWDCFHIATAMTLGCATVYSCDDGFLKRKTQLGIQDLRFSQPVPEAMELDFQPAKRDATGEVKAGAPEAVANQLSEVSKEKSAEVAPATVKSQTQTSEAGDAKIKG